MATTWIPRHTLTPWLPSVSHESHASTASWHRFHAADDQRSDSTFWTKPFLSLPPVPSREDEDLGGTSGSHESFTQPAPPEAYSDDGQSAYSGGGGSEGFPVPLYTVHSAVDELDGRVVRARHGSCCRSENEYLALCHRAVARGMAERRSADCG